jgi:hypothetical protein
MNYKKIIILLLIVGVTSTINYAQYNTGDSQLNLSLAKIDDDAKLSFSAFKADISLSYNVSESKIDSWSVKFGMKAGDIYMALEIAKLTKKQIEEVIKVYQSNKTKGWGAMAKQLGIKPGSPEFHALKNGADSRAKKSKGTKSPLKQKDEKAKPKGK